ncbi:MAG: hypothetical protein ACNA70_03985 [Brevefilum sp.]
MGLIARGLELAGVATTLTAWAFRITQQTLPPRATYTRLARGATLGQPGDQAQQQRVLRATLSLLAQDAPLDPVILDERAG